MWPGRNPDGSVNGTSLLPFVAMRPLKWTIPEMLRTAAPGEVDPPMVQPFFRVSLVNELPDVANEIPSSEVSVWALLQLCSGITATTPLGAISSCPAVPAARSTGTKTAVAGRSRAGRVNGAWLVPFVAISPLRWTIPEMLVTAGPAVPKIGRAHV